MTKRQAAKRERWALDYLRRCAENEGGRAVLAIRGYANEATAAYFAREAAHYARLLLESEGAAQ